MSNIETVDPVDDQIADLGEALSRRLANSGLPAGAAEDTQQTPEDEGAISAPASTDSTGEGEVAGDLTAPVTQPDAGLVASEGAASPGEGAGGDVDGAAAVTSPSTFTVDNHDYTSAEIQSMQKLRDWGNSLTPELRSTIAALESGQAGAIPADEWHRYQAWKTTQGKQQQQQPDILDGLDDDQIAYVRQLEQQVTQARQPDPTLVAQHQQQLKAGTDQWVLSYVNAAKSWGDERGLTEQQVSELSDYAVSQGVFKSFAEAEREYHPVNGTVMRDADPASVTVKALNFALASDPGLYTQIAERQLTQASRAQATLQADTAVSQKKARSASLAAAPSQASVTVPTDVTKLNRDELKSGMSKFIAEMEGIPQHD